MGIEQLSTGLVDPLQSMWMSVYNGVLGLIYAIVILIVGWIIAAVIARVVTKALEAAKLEKWMVERTNLRKIAGQFDPVTFLALITKWFVFVPFLASAATVIQLAPLSNFLLVLSQWVPNAIAGVAVAFFGFAASDYLAAKIESTKMRNASYVATAAQSLVLIVVALIVLEQVGLKVEVIKESFNIILAGIMLAFAIAVGMGFGDALKSDAAKMLKNLKR